MHVQISEKWNDYLELFPSDYVDIYYREEYVKLYSSNIDKALCIVCTSGDKIALMPFLRRTIYEYYDFETAYGYSGPIFNDRDEKWINDSLGAMQKCFKDNGYICGFIRFHPLLCNAKICCEYINVLYDRRTIEVSTVPSKEDIWSNQITSKNRNMIRKAEKNGLKYTADSNYESIKDFIGLYEKTMTRLDAEVFYYFDNNYYSNFVKYIADSGFLGVVRLKDKIVGAALFMQSGKYGHYHLAGSDRDYASLGINNFLLWNTIIEMKNRGVEQFHLGGGTSDDSNDSLLKFKKTFSRTEKEFYIGKWIFDESVYNQICTDWEKENPNLVEKYGNRLLKYRYTKGD